MSQLKRIEKLEAWAAERLPIVSKKDTPLGRVFERYMAGELLTPEWQEFIQPYLEVFEQLVAEGYDEGLEDYDEGSEAG